MERIAVLYFLLQGVGGTLWWLGLFWFPMVRKYFMAPGSPDTTLLAFALADIFLYVLGSFVCAYVIIANTENKVFVLAIQSGASCYAAMYCLFLYAISGGGLLGAVMMFPSLFMPLFFAGYFYKESKKC